MRRVWAMTTIYVVTDGEYDDWHILEIFSTREKAEEYIESGDIR